MGIRGGVRTGSTTQTLGGLFTLCSLAGLALPFVFQPRRTETKGLEGLFQILDPLGPVCVSGSLASCSFSRCVFFIGIEDTLYHSARSDSNIVCVDLPLLT